MITKYKLVFFTGILVLSLLITIFSCKKETDDPGFAPVLPPIESILMDFSDFSNPDDTLPGKKASETSLIEYMYRNWGHSFSTVSFWNAIATVTLAIPTSSYLQALENDPVYKGDNTWEWNAFYTGVNATYEIRLVTQKISFEEYSAVMFVTKENTPGFTDFKWFEGIIHFDRTHAIWTLYESPANPVRIVDIEWNKNWENNTGDIRYTYVKPESQLEGSFIEYRVSADPVYNRRYTVDFNGESTLIEWNQSTKNGQVKDFLKFGDNNWHCWNILLQDTTCD